MNAHKYRLGQRVIFTGFIRTKPASAEYEVTRLLPPSGDDQVQYRLKSLAENHERVAREDQLDLPRGASAP